MKSYKVYYISNQLLQCALDWDQRFMYLLIMYLCTFGSKILCTLDQRLVHLLCAQLSRDTNLMYPSFQVYIRFVSLLFPLIRLHKAQRNSPSESAQSSSVKHSVATWMRGKYSGRIYLRNIYRIGASWDQSMETASHSRQYP